MPTGQSFTFHGTRTVNINPPTQQELDLETISAGITIKFRPREKEYLKQLAEKRGLEVSVMLRRMIFHHIKVEPSLNELHQILENILT
jgi:hypothetical protein